MISSGFPILGGPGSRRFRRFLPTHMRGRKRPETVDDRPVPSGIVHALRCGGRRAERGVYGKVSSALRQEAPRIRLTGCSSTVPASGFIAAPAAEKGPWPMVSAAPKADATPGSTPSATTRAAPCFVNCVLLPTPGNVHDCKVAQRCIEAMPPSAEPAADKGREGRKLREWLEERGTGPVIPPRKNRKSRYPYDQAIYSERDIIERISHRLKDRRRIATHFERNIKNVMAAIARAAALISWL